MQKFGGSWDDHWAVGQIGSGFVRFDGDFVHIQHSGGLSRLTVGKGAKRVPLQAITAIQIKPAGPVVAGYIQFTMGGAVEARSRFGRQSFDAVGDENSIMFSKREQPHFEVLRSTIEQAMAEARRPAVDRGVTQMPVDLVGQLRGLAELRDAGVLTDAEFEQKKAEILRRM